MSAPNNAITAADAAKIVANLEANGRPVPPELRAAAEGAGAPAPAAAAPRRTTGTAVARKAPAKAPVKPTGQPAASVPPRARPAKTSPGAPAKTGAPGKAGKSAGRGRLRKWADGKPTKSTIGKDAKSLIKSPRTLGGGDGGGLLLVFWLYGPVLAMIKHGPAGAGMWIRAKFLNQTIDSATGKATADLGSLITEEEKMKENYLKGDPSAGGFTTVPKKAPNPSRGGGRTF